MNAEFLERSLADLEREHEAGDLTDRHYRQLKADYERRLRGEAPLPRPGARRSLVVASVAFVVVVAVAAGVLVARSAGRRAIGATFTGNAAVTTPALAPAPVDEDLARCATLEGTEAIDCYTGYTEANPDDPEGWMRFGLFAVNAGVQGDSDELLTAGETFLERAVGLDPDAVEPRVYLAVLLERTGQTDRLAEECTALATADVPTDLSELVTLACP